VHRVAGVNVALETKGQQRELSISQLRETDNSLQIKKKAPEIITNLAGSDESIFDEANCLFQTLLRTSVEASLEPNLERFQLESTEGGNT
jgi:hypothetical protein